MSQETKTCQNCKQNFTIEPEDFTFYERIKVPPPTWCPECRLRRQVIFRNLRALYKRNCGVPDHRENLISLYHPDAPVRVFDQQYWWSDKWDVLDYGKEYDFSRPFFQQLDALIKNVPWPNVVITNSVASDYCNSVIDMKNCYLVFAATGCENCAYCEQVEFSRDSFDLKKVHVGELCYELFLCNDCYKVIFSGFSDNCSESAFLIDCKGCSHCFGCIGLRNKSYYIFNEPYSKNDYLRKLEEFDFGSFDSLSSLREKFDAFHLKYPYRYARIYHSVNATGDNLKNARNCYNCFEMIGGSIEDSRYVTHPYGKPSKDCQSIFTVSAGELSHDSISIRECSNILFSKKIWTGHHVRYSYNCHNCDNLFGCVGLRNKSYCIFNKQYTKEEYEKLVPRIIEHMNKMPHVDKQGRTYKYGEFFPPDLSPFAYNETIAQEYFPLAKEEALEKGYRWRDPDTRDYRITKKSEDLPDHIKDIGDEILNDVIQCLHNQECNEQCTQAFKIIPQELQFYKKMNLPLPRLCPNCRHYQRLKQRNPLKLWHRQCQCAGQKSENGVYTNTTAHFHNQNHCPNEFETSYAPERKEIVYCEQCYQVEVV